jgi:hypothetical protein
MRVRMHARDEVQVFVRILFQANFINALAVTILRFFEPAGHYIG